MIRAIRITFILSIIFNSQVVRAQLIIPKAKFQGIEYSVYPARVKPWFTSGIETMNFNYTTGLKFQFEHNLFYNPFIMPDGDYIIYYQKARKTGAKERIKQKDTTHIAAIVSFRDNLKNGSAKWYDQDGKLIQSGQYDRDRKTGDWKIFHDKYVLSYHYDSDTVNGSMTLTYKQHILYSCDVSDGFINGRLVKYDEKGRILKESFYDTATVTSRNGKTEFVQLSMKEISYFKNGKIKTIHTPQLKDTTFIRFNKKGVMIALDCADSNRYEYFWHNDGSLKQYRMNGGNNCLYSQIFASNASINSSWSDNLVMARYHKNGRLEFKYDFRTSDTLNPIHFYRKNGSIYQTIQFSSAGSDIDKHLFTMNSTEFRKTFMGKKEIQKTKVYLYRNLLFSSESGEYASELSYWDLKYPDSIGIVQLNSPNSTDRKYNRSNHLLSHRKVFNYVLHSGLGFYDNFYNGINCRDFNYRRSDSLTSNLEVTINDWDQNHELCIRYSYLIKTQPGKIYPNRYDHVLHHARILYQPADTLNYEIWLKGKPFSGIINLSTVESSEAEMTYTMVLTNPSTLELNVKICKNHAFFYPVNYRLFVKNGLVESVFFTDKEKYYVHYSNQKRNGTTNLFTFSCAYVNGQKHGTFRDLYSLNTYTRNQLDGEWIKFSNNGQIDYKTNYHKDTVDGWLKWYGTPYQERGSVFINKGIPQGRYWYCNRLDDTMVSARIENGFLTDTVRYFYSTGVLKAEVVYSIADSAFYAGHSIFINGFCDDYDSRFNFENSDLIYLEEEFIETHKNPEKFPIVLKQDLRELIFINSLNEEYGLLQFDDTQNGKYVLYYKNGIKASEGTISNGYKKGTWKHWDINGGPLKEIDYSTGIYFNPVNGDSIKYYGKITAWHPNGNMSLKGLVLSAFQQYQCNLDLDVSFENIFYLNMWDATGKELITNNSGKVYEYYDNGNRRLEGTILNGKKNGIWFYYDAQGRLTETGEYHNDHKIGIWYQGNLEAISAIKNSCAPDGMTHLETPDIYKTGYLQQKIHISEINYNSDEVIWRNSIDLFPLFGSYYFNYGKGTGWEYYDSNR